MMVVKGKLRITDRLARNKRDACHQSRSQSRVSSVHDHLLFIPPTQTIDHRGHVFILWAVRTQLSIQHSSQIIFADQITHCYVVPCFNSGKTRTFKPRKDAPEGTKQYQLRKYAEATLVRENYATCELKEISL